MNKHSAIADSDESAVVGVETNANQAGSSSCAGASAAESFPAQAMPRRNESDESNKWLRIEHAASDPGQARPSTLDEVIKQTLVRLLRETQGNRRRTASQLGISRSTLYRMLERYGIGHVGRDAAKSREPRIDRAMPPAVPPVPTA
jgi:DNA-binding NtrC family response regulator